MKTTFLLSLLSLLLPLTQSFSLIRTPRPSSIILKSTAWSDLELPLWLNSRLKSLETYNSGPLPIQALSIPPLLAKTQSAAIIAPTSSGKTLSYLIPLLSAVDPDVRNAVQGLVIVPSRELGLQVAGVAKRLAGGSGIFGDSERKLMVMNLLEGSGLTRQKSWALDTPPDVVIGTVTEVLHFIESGYLRVNNLNFVVVDEVDEMFEGKLIGKGEGEGIKRLLGRVLSSTFKDGDEDENDEESNNLYVNRAVEEERSDEL